MILWWPSKNFEYNVIIKEKNVDYWGPYYLYYNDPNCVGDCVFVFFFCYNAKMAHCSKNFVRAIPLKIPLSRRIKQFPVQFPINNNV